MDQSFEQPENAASEFRILLIGERWAGKSSSANTILGEERFECGRIRTTEAEVRHEVVGGRKLVVVDAPGWSHRLSLTEIPEGDKQRFKLNASKCPPGPNAFLLVVPIDKAFTEEQKTIVRLYMNLLGRKVWQFTMVLFTCGDNLGEKMIEQHIESEGEALKWLVEKCGNRYHVFNNNDNGNSSQVTQLLVKIEEMVAGNGGGHYKTDGQDFNIIKAKQQEVAERAKERQKKTEEQKQNRMSMIPDDMEPISEVRMILLGSRRVGKTSAGNTILGYKDTEDDKQTTQSVIREGFVDKTAILLVDTPGWWKNFPAADSPEVIKEEIMYSMSFCRPGPHVFLLMIDADSSFNDKHLKATTTHMELLGEGVWKHTIIVFTRGDWLGSHSIEQFIEGEGEALKSLVERCGNRYHVIDSKNPNDCQQVTELLEKVTWAVAENNVGHFVPDEQMFVIIENKRRRVKEGAMQRLRYVRSKHNFLKGSRMKLKELKIVMLGQKSSGKSATGNTILCKKVFASCQNEQCKMETGQVAERLVTLIDVPGWWEESSRSTKELDEELARGLSLSSSGVHAVLLVIPLDLKFTEAQRITLDEHMDLFESNIWEHTILVFTYGDDLAGRSIEEHIEREQLTLGSLVGKCHNKYHTMNNRKKDVGQVTELFEKIDEMVEENRGQLFCPDTNKIQLRINEKYFQRQIKQVLKQKVLTEYKKRDLQRMTDFRDTLLDLQQDIGQIGTRAKPKFPTISKTKGEKVTEQTVCAKIQKEIEKLNLEIMKSTQHLSSSMEGMKPDLREEGPLSHVPGERELSLKVLNWLSSLRIGTNVDNQLTLKFDQSVGYKSMTSLDSLENSNCEI